MNIKKYRKIILLPTLLFAVLFLTLMIYESSKLSTDDSNVIKTHIISRKTEVTYDESQTTQDDLIEIRSTKKYVFFDLGVNNGDSLLMFLKIKNRGKDKQKTKKIWLSNIIKDFYVGFTGGSLTISNFGLEAEQARWDVYAFEANPNFIPILEEIKPLVEEKHNFNLYLETAAWTFDGIIEFYVDTDTREAWGSSLRKDHPKVIKSGSRGVTVDCIDLAKIIGKYNKNDFIVVKMDIEGTEYELLMDFIKKSVFHLVDFMAIEFHPQFTKHKTAENFLIELMNVTGVKYFEWK